MPDLLRFKENVLISTGRRPACDRITVDIDLRDDWPTALCDAGFHPAEPSGWLVEGFLHLLDPDSSAHLLNRITALAAPGSWLALEDAPSGRSAGMRAGTGGDLVQDGHHQVKFVIGNESPDPLRRLRRIRGGGRVPGDVWDTSNAAVSRNICGKSEIPLMRAALTRCSTSQVAGMADRAIWVLV